MHEARLMSDLIHRIRTLAENERASRVVGVSVWIGALSHMSAEHFAEHFEDSAAGTIAEGARVEVTLSDDLGHSHAQEIILKDVELEI